MNRKAKLAGLEGWAILRLEDSEHGQLLTGLWEAQDPDRALPELHRHYMARERIVYEGPVAPDDSDHADERHLEVIILEWSKDRKSTRLNSSHVAISYAVFCLKKKKDKQQNALTQTE